MKKPRHPVSDHAVVRYLERVRGIDIDRLRAKIGRTAGQALELGACSAVSGGFVYRIQNGVVTTITPHNLPDRRTDRSGKKGPRDD
jgi:hypothetical protein